MKGEVIASGSASDGSSTEGQIEESTKASSHRNFSHNDDVPSLYYVVIEPRMTDTTVNEKKLNQFLESLETNLKQLETCFSETILSCVERKSPLLICWDLVKWSSLVRQDLTC
ncbi:uncharacterized protein LOC143233854 isoform X1 [Tachypleus tridentatus]|uniref:uncharacterized protein LOC143233854 isoform X1 n=1 Tax=Tachypleus tridentatus TaxID=6853 RepID=UPI003FD4B563